MQSPELDIEAFAAAYAVVYGGGRLTTEVWTPARDVLRYFADNAVRRAAGHHIIPSRTIPERVEEVHGELVEKFVRKTLGPPESINNWESFLRVVSQRATITVLRRIKSIPVGHLETEPGVKLEALEPALEDADVFVSIRARMEPFRFPEFALVRDFLLAWRLATTGYLPAASLRMVPTGMRSVCHAAAVFDINTALLEITP